MNWSENPTHKVYNTAKQHFPEVTLDAWNLIIWSQIIGEGELPHSLILASAAGLKDACGFWQSTHPSYFQTQLHMFTQQCPNLMNPNASCGTDITIPKNKTGCDNSREFSSILF